MTIHLASSTNYTYLDIDTSHQITFPCFMLPKQPEIKDGLVLLDGKVVDDRNINADTIGARRLRTEHDLRRIKVARLDIVEFLKGLQSRTVWAIDRNGMVIKYRKSRNESITCHRIRKVLKKETYSIALLDGVDFPIELRRPPYGSYMQMLHYEGFPWKPWDVLDEAVPNTYKKV